MRKKGWLKKHVSSTARQNTQEEACQILKHQPGTLNCAFSSRITGVRIELSTKRESGMGCHVCCLLGFPYIAIGIN